MQNWTQIFDAANPKESHSICLRVLSKSGRPFLLLPDEPELALRTLALYPAQSALARVIKKILAAAFSLRFTLPLERISLKIPTGSPLANFLATLTRLPSGALPRFGILIGNPNAPGQRCVLIAFDDTQRAIVVKAGASTQACELIRREIVFLESVNPALPGIPRLCAKLDGDGLSAFALPFAEGEPPGIGETEKAGAMVESWLKKEAPSPVSSFANWLRLEAACSGDAIFDRLAARLGDSAVVPSVTHGDLAPWNIKVAPGGQWLALDWERGDLHGLPGWDWFHFVVQPAVLVQKQNISRIVDSIDALFASVKFQDYAAKSRITSIQTELVLAYLLFCTRVIRQTEGVSQIESLTRRIACRLPAL